MSLDCVWEQARTPLKERRKGLGSLKTRVYSDWKPDTIVPVSEDKESQQRRISENQIQPLVPADVTAEPSSLPDKDLEFLKSFLELHSDKGILTQDGSQVQQTPSFQLEGDKSFMAYQFGETWPRFTLPVGGTEPTIYRLETSLMALPFNLPMPNGITLTTLDHQAIEYYSTEFSLAQVIKRFPWSTYSLLLRFGYEKAIVMRFMLAASLNELYRRGPRSDPKAKQLADVHFQAGCELFSRSIMDKDQESVDHSSILASAFFSYIYLSRRKSVDRQRIQSLSRIVSEYVRRYNLNASQPGLGTPTAASRLFSSPTAGPPGREKLLSRLIRWNYFKDVQMCFHGCGGSLASQINASRGRLRQLGVASISTEEDSWESK